MCRLLAPHICLLLIYVNAGSPFLAPCPGPPTQAFDALHESDQRVDYEGIRR